MKTLVNVVILLAGITILVGCVEDEADSTYYTTNASSGYVATYEGDVTSGYNRDFIQQKKKNEKSL